MRCARTIVVTALAVLILSHASTLAARADEVSTNLAWVRTSSGAEPAPSEPMLFEPSGREAASSQHSAEASKGTQEVLDTPSSVVHRRVERRMFRKDGHVVARTAFSYLARGDFYNNPGVSLAVAWYVDESLALDLLSSTVFFASLDGAAESIRRSQGFLPDSQKPIVRATTGVRYAFAYGKLLLESLDWVVHLDAGVSGHAGLFITDQAPNPGGDVMLDTQVLIHSRFLAIAEVGWVFSFEDRTESKFASGILLSVGFGLVL